MVSSRTTLPFQGPKVWWKTEKKNLDIKVFQHSNVVWICDVHSATSFPWTMLLGERWEAGKTAWKKCRIQAANCEDNVSYWRCLVFESREAPFLKIDGKLVSSLSQMTLFQTSKLNAHQGGLKGCKCVSTAAECTTITRRGWGPEGETLDMVVRWLDGA